MLGVWWMVTSAGAQSYFNKRETLHSFASIATSVIESNDHYYTTGDCLDSVNIYGPNNYGGGIRFAVWGKDGKLLHDTVFVLPFRDIYGFGNNLRRLSNGSFLIADYDIDSGNAFHQLIVNFDSTGHVLWYKELSKTTCGGNANQFWRLEDFQPTGTGEWLLLATEACHQNNNQSDYNLVKLDSAFNIIWEKTYGDPAKNNYGGKLLIDGNNYIMAGGMNTYNVLPHATTFQAEIYKLDTAGNVLAHSLIPNAKHTDAIKDIIKTQDGGYVYCGNGAGYELTPQQFFTDLVWKSWVQKLDANFNPVWADTFSTLPSNTGLVQLVKLIEHADGSLIVAGEVGGGFLPAETAARNYGALIKLRSDGSIVWQKKYAVPDDTLQHKVYDMKQTSDGGYILCGEATDGLYPYTPPTQQAWLIKVDSNGCSSANDPQCWAVAVPHNPSLTTSEYKVYPNPASDHFSIYYSNTSGSGISIQIIDMVGRKIVESPLPGKTGTANIDVRNFQSGIYMYRILEGDRCAAQGKILKN